MMKVFNLPPVRFFASLKLTVACLAWLFVITFWGTIDQVENGLYVSQQKFFTSYFFHAGSFVWLPGAKLAMMVLFINLLAASRRFFQFRRSKSGIFLIHVGLLTFFVAAFLTYVCAEESQITLIEGESTNTAQSLTTWELAVWQQESDHYRSVVAYDVDFEKIGKRLEFEKWGLNITVKDYIANAVPMRNREEDKVERFFHSMPPAKNPEENKPAVIILVEDSDGKAHDLALYGPEGGGIKLSKGEDQIFFIALRRSRAVLSFDLTLKDFRPEFHPKTEIAKSFESDVIVDEGQGPRPVRISMNKPLRIDDFTVYQASYGENASGLETSTFAVVKNPARLFPYFASILTTLGLFLHVLIMTVSRRSGGGRS